MAVTAAGTVTVTQITPEDIRPVAAFLHAELNANISVEDWADAIAQPWEVEKPNAGYMLLDGDEVVGAQLAFYSERLIDGRYERFCNLGAWCVSPAYRLHALRLLRSVLRQDGFHFTDLSPSGNVVRVNERLKFQHLDTTTALVPNFPWPSWPRRSLISSDPELIERTVTGRDLEVYRDHAAAGAAHHVVLIRDGEWCYVVFRGDRRKNLPLFASLLYVSNPTLFRAMARPFARHLLLHHRALAMLAEERILGYRPRPSLRLRSPRRKMFRSPSLAPTQIDYLYSELVCVSW